MRRYLEQCAANAGPCDQSLLRDCGQVVGVLNDSYLSAAATCVEAGGSPSSCLVSAIDAATPTAAHQQFGMTFCDECAFGVSGCEEAFSGGMTEEGSDLAIAGALVLPFGDSFVSELATECATGLTCLATFSSCAQQTLAARALPEDTIECLIDQLTSGGGGDTDAGMECSIEADAGAGDAGVPPGMDGSVPPPPVTPPPVPPPAECMEGLSRCGDACVDLQSSTVSCGACGVSCDPDQVCSAGTCSGAGCGSLTDCSGECVDVRTSPLHCGGCDNPCPFGFLCRSGICDCPDPGTMCGGACVDTTNDPDNCGTCGVACSISEVCRLGTCECPGGSVERDCVDGSDDDCDGARDCADTDCIGATRACSSGAPGVETCMAGGRWGDCESPMTCDATADRYEPNDACDRCHRITEGAPDIDVTLTGGTMHEGDAVDCFVFQAEDGTFSINEQVVVELTVPDGVDYDVMLYRGLDACLAGDALARSTASTGADETITWTERFSIDDGDHYYVWVYRFGDACTAEPYTLHIRGLE